MKQPLWRQLNILARQLTPFGLAATLVILGLTPIRAPGFAEVAPMLALIAIYHWAIYRPELLPAIAVFMIGLLQDMLSSIPLGINTVVFMMVYGAVLSQRRFFIGKSFLITWLGFALVAMAATIVKWVLVSVLAATLAGGWAAFHQFLVTLGCFPLLSWLLLRWQRSILRHDA